MIPIEMLYRYSQIPGLATGHPTPTTKITVQAEYKHSVLNPSLRARSDIALLHSE